MKKNIYKEVPQTFHDQLCRTLEGLEDSPRTPHIRRKKYGLLLAAAILACASVTAAAVGVMQWHERTSERFGTEKELEDKLTMDGVSISQEAQVQDSGLSFKAIQAVRTADYYYFLLQMTVPDFISWNEDILLETCEAFDQNLSCEIGCVANFVSDSVDNHTVLLEIQLYPDGEIEDTEKLTLRMRNLVQTEKTDITEYLVKGEWEIPLTLPAAEADTVTFFLDRTLNLAEHNLYFSKADVSPFRIRLYADEDLAPHAVWGSRITLAGVWYEDGTSIEEESLHLSMLGHTDEADAYYFEFPLEHAIDTDKIAGIVLAEGEQEIRIPLKEPANQEMPTEETTALPDEFPEGTQLSDVKLIYVRYDHAILSDGQSVYWWDTLCGRIQTLFSLEPYGFSYESGGEIIWAQASQIAVLPYSGSEQVYLYDISGSEMLKLDAESFWPWPTYDRYKETIKAMKKLYPDADEHYSDQAVSSIGELYYLYSESGLAQDMELKKWE